IENPPPKPEETKDKKPDVPDLAAIKGAVRELNPGDATDFVATEKGGLVAVLEKRDPGDPAGYAAAKASFEKNYLQSKRMVFFDGWHALGMALMKTGRFPEAIAAGKKATELRPNDQIAWTSLSLFYNRNGDIKEAEAAGTKAKILSWGGKVAKELSERGLSAPTSICRVAALR